MSLYHVQFDGESWWVEAPDYGVAVRIWREYITADWNVANDETEEPESVTLISTQPVIRYERHRETAAAQEGILPPLF